MTMHYLKHTKRVWRKQTASIILKWKENMRADSSNQLMYVISNSSSFQVFTMKIFIFKKKKKASTIKIHKLKNKSLILGGRRK